MNVYAGEGTSGALLASQSIGAPAGNEFQSLLLSTPVPVVGGSRYTIELVASSTHWSFTTVDTYAGGQASLDPDFDMAFRTYLSTFEPAIHVDPSGAIGIGTTQPQHDVHVVGDVVVEGGGFLGADSGPLPSAVGAGVRIFYDEPTSVGSIFAYDYPLQGPRDLVLQQPGGNVGIGTSTPTHTLEVNGTAAKPGAGAGRRPPTYG